MATLAPAPAAQALIWARHIVGRLDWLLVLGVGAITIFGLKLVDITTADDPGGSLSSRHLIYVALGVAVMAAAMAIDLDLFRRRVWTVWGALIGAVTIVQIIGAPIRGSRRWIDFGVFQFQPSEIGKVAMIIILAAIISERRSEIGTPQFSLLALGTTVLPAIIVFVQPDLGTSLVYFAILIGMLFFAGIPAKHFVAAGSAIVGFGVLLLWVLPSIGLPILREYQVNRILVLFDPSRDLVGTGYQAAQTKTAVGAGGAFGRGADGATQVRNDILPEHHTDFIFAAAGEIYGFVGVVTLILVLSLVIWRAIRIMMRAPTMFEQLIAGGIAAMLAFQVFVNIGMNVTIMPITGIPLPFMSYGGSHTLTNLIAVGILLRIHRRSGAMAR